MMQFFKLVGHTVRSSLRLFLLLCAIFLIFTAHAEAACPTDTTNTYSSSTTISGFNVGSKKVCITGATTIVTVDSMLGSNGQVYVTNGARVNFSGGGVAVNRFYLDVDGSGLVTITNGAFNSTTIFVHGGQIQATGGSFSCRSVYVMPGSTFTRNNASGSESVNTSGLYNLGTLSVSMNSSTIFDSELYNGTGGTFTFNVPNFTGTNGKRTSSVNMTGSNANALSTHTTINDFTQYSLPDCSTSTAGAAASATFSATANPIADLAVTKTNSVSSVNANSSTIYTITVTNNGPSAAIATLADPAVTGLNKTAVACGTTPGVCVTPPTVASLQAGFNTPSIPSGGTYQINVTTTVTATSGSVENAATVAPPSGTTDPNNSNNSSTDTDSVTPMTNLGVTKTDSLAVVNAGATTNYVINVTNSGPSPSAAILTDPAVTGLNVTAVVCHTTPGVCLTPPSIANLQAGFTTPSIPVGGTYQIRVTATVTATSGTVANTATVAPPVGSVDPTPANNSSTDTNNVTPIADLVVVKTDGNTTASSGSSIVYTVTVTNNGPSPSTATLSDPIATGLTKTAVSCGTTPGVCTTPPTIANLQAGFVTPVIPAGETYQLNVTTTVTALSGSVINTATATTPSGTTDPTTPNNSSDTDSVVLTADLAVVKTNGVSAVNAGSSTVYTLTVTNNGPSAATARLTDPAVTGLNKTAVACGTTPGVCATPPTIANLQAGFTTPSIPSGGSYQLKVTTTVTATSGSVANTATVAPPVGTTDPNNSNDSSTDTDTVTPVAPVTLQDMCSAQISFTTAAAANTANGLLDYTQIYTGAVGVYENVGGLGVDLVLQARNQDGSALSGGLTLDGTTSGIYHNTAPWRLDIAYYRTGTNQIVPASTANFSLSLEDFEAAEGIRIPSVLNLSSTELGPVNIRDDTSVIYNPGVASPGPSYSADGQTILGFFPTGGGIQTGKWAKVRLPTSEYHQLTVMIDKFGGNNSVLRLCSPYASSADLDRSDAPASYAEAWHDYTPSTLRLGASVDFDDAPIMSVDALGDGADDDGVTVPTLVVGTTSYTIPAANISAIGSGTLHAWVDFNRDGAFSATEYKAVTVTNGVLSGNLVWTGITTGAAGSTFARFRLTSTSLTDDTGTTGVDERASGAASNGEVEDYPVTVAAVPVVVPFNCTPDLYQVTEGIFQRFHRTANTYVQVGTPVDFNYSIGYRKADGFIYGIVTPSATLGSDGVDSNGTPVVVGDLVQVDVNGQVTKLVSTGTPITDNHDAAAIHEGNGTLWARTGDSSTSAQLSEFNLTTGAVLNTLSVTNGGIISGDLIIVGNTAYRWWTDVMYSIPLYGPTAGQATAAPMIGPPAGTRGSGAAFALTDPDNPGSIALYWPENVTGDLYKITGFTTGNPVAVKVSSTPASTANDGASCDSATALFLGDDYSDAPSSFGVAAHGLDNSLRLGASVTADNGAVQDADNASDDGVASFPVLNTADSSYAVSVNVTNTSGAAATLHAWIDMDGNGVFDNDEHTSVAVPNGTNSGTVILNWASLPGLISGVSEARFRLTTDTLTAANASTGASDGEVEDYPLTITTSGFSLSGKVYHDTNVNGVNNSEAGIKNITIVLYDTAANTCQSTRTAADGSYRFSPVAPAAANNYIVYEAAAETLPEPNTCPPVEADPNGFISTTPNSQTVTVSTAHVSGVDFGDVKLPQFTLEHSQTILPGSTVTYPHRFTTSAAGTVSFSLAELADPAHLSWEANLWLDTNCNAELDGGDLPLTGSLAVSAGDTLCLLAKVLAPTDVSSGASYTLDVMSSFTYGDGSLIPTPVEQTRTDLTRTNAGTPTDPVEGAGKLKLSKSVWNVTRNIDGEVALPGETLRYTIAYENIGDGQLDELIVYDRVPTYTQLVGASQQCGTTPPELSACTPFISGEDLEWSFTGQLRPGSQGEVFYDVIVE